MNDIVKLALDTYHGTPEKYSVDKSLEVLRDELVAANGGSTKLDYRAIRDGKCTGLFTLVEEIITRTVKEGLEGDEYFNNLVDFRDVGEGDKNEFVVEDSDLFVVAEIAKGTQGIRRQRLGGVNVISIPTLPKAVRIYEELNRVLAGNVDFNKFIAKVSESFKKQILDDTYNCWKNATAADFGGSTYFPAAGSYNEGTLLDLIEHVEAAAGGKTATIIGTKKALRNLAPSIQGSDSKSDLYNEGFYGKFYGANVVAMPQRHATGTTNFIFSDTSLDIVAGDEKLIKVVREGNPLVNLGNPFDNADLTQEYFYCESYGVGLVTAGNSGYGRYTF